MTDTKKRKYQIEHTRKRAWERLDIGLSKKECERIADNIRSQTGDCTLIGKVSFHLSIWRVKIRDVLEVIVVYDKKTNAPVTIMTEEIFKGQKMYRTLVPVGDKLLTEGLGDNAHLAAELSKVKVVDD